MAVENSRKTIKKTIVPVTEKQVCQTTTVSWNKNRSISSTSKLIPAGRISRADPRIFSRVPSASSYTYSSFLFQSALSSFTLTRVRR